MKKLFAIPLLLAIAMSTSGCALLGAAVIGGVIAHDCDYRGDCYWRDGQHYHHRPIVHHR